MATPLPHCSKKSCTRSEVVSMGPLSRVTALHRDHPPYHFPLPPPLRSRNTGDHRLGLNSSQRCGCNSQSRHSPSGHMDRDLIWGHHHLLSSLPEQLRKRLLSGGGRGSLTHGSLPGNNFKVVAKNNPRGQVPFHAAFHQVPGVQPSRPRPPRYRRNTAGDAHSTAESARRLQCLFLPCVYW